MSGSACAFKTRSGMVLSCSRQVAIIRRSSLACSGHKRPSQAEATSLELLGKIGRARVDTSIKPQLAGDETALVRPAGDPDRMAPFEFGDLSDYRPDGARSCRNDDSFVGLRLADLEKTEIRRPPQHPENSVTLRRSSSKSAKLRVFNKSFGLAGFFPKRRCATESKLFSPKACVDTESQRSPITAPAPRAASPDTIPKSGKARIEAPMREAQSSPAAHRGARVIGTDALRIVLISPEPSDGQERKQDNKGDPNINAHQSSPAADSVPVLWAQANVADFSKQVELALFFDILAVAAS